MSTANANLAATAPLSLTLSPSGGEREMGPTATANSTSTANPTATANATSTVALSQPLPSSSSPSSAGTVAAGLFLAALAAAALVLARRRKRAPRLVEIVETASLGPKRSLVVARMGDELLLLGASEGGISLLTTRAAPQAAPLAAADPLPQPLAAVPALPHAAPARVATEIAGSVVGLFSRFKRGARPDASPAFEALLSESVEDAELRRKLAAGQAGSVR
jgi:flagellar protein FliO/FliZ